jgi:hypothetical protein
MAMSVPSRQALSHPEHNEWVRKLARVGYAAKGVVYGLIGVLALQAAFGSGGQLAGGQEAVQYIDQQPFGKILLGVIGIGLLGYALWRFIAAAKDPERKAQDGKKGLVKRIGWAGSGVANAAVAFTALQLALGNSAGGSNNSWVAKLMDQPFGQVLVGIIGVGILAHGLGQIGKAYTAKFMQDLRVNQMNAQERKWALRVGRAGLASRGVVFGVVGVFLTKAAIEHNPGQAKGFGEALAAIAASTGGVFMLIVIAAGLVAYGAHELMSAKYRKFAPR